MAEVIHNRQQHRFELGFEGREALAAARYRLDAMAIASLPIPRFRTNFSVRELARAWRARVFDDARASGIKLVLKCPSMAGWFARHPQYGDLVAG